MTARWPAVAAIAVAAVATTMDAQRVQLPPGLQEMDRQSATLAAEAAARGPVTPIPITGGTGRAMGAVYDQYLVGVVIGRNQMAAGQTPNPETIAAHPLFREVRGTVVVAYPINCDGQPNTPIAIRWTSRSPLPATVHSGPSRGAEAQAMLPGVGLPADAMVITFQNASLTVPGSTVEIDYADPVCRGGARTLTMSLAYAPGPTSPRSVNAIRLPAEHASLPSPSTVYIRFMMDPLGRVRFPTQVQGPPELGPLAIAMITSQTYSAGTINGVPMPGNQMLSVVYTATGEPATRAPYQPAAQPGLVSTRTEVVTTTQPMVTASAPAAPVAAAPPGLLDTQLARIAAEVAAKGDPVPVPLDSAGPAVHGVLFDRFLMGVLKARAAAKAGAAIDPATAPPTLVQNDMVAVAYPVSCEGRVIAPVEIGAQIGGAQPGPVRQTGVVLSGSALVDRLPGVALPAGALGRTFASVALSQSLEFRITYAEPPCGGTERVLSFPIQWERAQAAPRMTTVKLPAGSSLPSPTQVRVRGTVDLDGTYRFPSLADGPPELAVTAAAVASQWKFSPYRANGSAIPLSTIMTLTFTASGMPEPAALAPPPGSGPPSTAPPNVMTSSTVGGRSTTDFTTGDVAGLSAETSKCEIASEPTYGFSPAAAIQVGGSFTEGPARARQYLNALRGPAGQGLRIVRRGSTMGADSQTILDLYEITYAGLAAPLRLFVDQYHEAPLRAPQGLTCAAPVRAGGFSRPEIR